MVVWLLINVVCGGEMLRGFGEILNSQFFFKILPKVLAKLSAIFRLLPQLFFCPQKN